MTTPPLLYDIAFHALLRRIGRRQWCYLPTCTNTLAADNRGCRGWRTIRELVLALYRQPTQPQLARALQQYTTTVVLDRAVLSDALAGVARPDHAPRCFKELDDNLGRSRRPTPYPEHFFWIRWLQTKLGKEENPAARDAFMPLLKKHLYLLRCGGVHKMQENCTSSLPILAVIERLAVDGYLSREAWLTGCESRRWFDRSLQPGR